MIAMNAKIISVLSERRSIAATLGIGQNFRAQPLFLGAARTRPTRGAFGERPNWFS